MKKLFAIITILGSVFSTTVHAQSKTPSPVLTSFQSSFDKAENTSWSNVKGLYRVDFTIEDQKLSAFYNPSGELVASSRDVSLEQIPMALKYDLEKNFDGYKVTSLFEVDNKDGITYYATVNNIKSQFILESTSSGDWVSHKRITDNE